MKRKETTIWALGHAMSLRKGETHINYQVDYRILIILYGISVLIFLLLIWYLYFFFSMWYLYFVKLYVFVLKDNNAHFLIFNSSLRINLMKVNC